MALCELGPSGRCEVSERVGGERLFLSVPCDWPELSEDEKIAWAMSVNERLLARGSLTPAGQ